MAAAAWLLDGPDHRVLAATRKARESGGTGDGIIGRPAREVLPNLVTDEVLGCCDEVYRTGRVLRGQQWLVDADADADAGAVRAAGAGVAVLTATVIPIADRDGRVRGLVLQIDIDREELARREAKTTAALLGQRLRQAREVVLTVQRSLLPAVLPVLPDVSLAARYLVASSEQAACGDWFDAVPLGKDLALVVGDVVGHGAAASGVMGQLRAVLMEFLLDGVGLAEALARLDRFAVRVPGGRGATVCVAKLERSTGRLSYVCSGHLPPMVISPDGSVRSLSSRSGGPLGVDSAAATVEEATLAPGDVVVLYSDGLIERSGRTLQAGIDMLAQVASTAMTRVEPYPDSASDRICELVVDALADGDYPDDVTMLAAEVGRPAPVPLATTSPAVPGVLAELRLKVADWLAGLGVAPDDEMSIQAATGEAVANVVEHAYPDGEGTIQLEALLDDDGRVCVTVADEGRWKPPAGADPTRGRGLSRMRSCMDSVEIEHDHAGTTVLMERQLTRPVTIGDDGEVAATRVPGTSELTITSTSGATGPVVSVGGPVDIVTAGAFMGALRRAGRAGVLPLTVDLTEVTILASAGVQALYEHCEEAMSSGRRVRVIAPPRSPSRDVLKFSGLVDLVDLVDE